MILCTDLQKCGYLNVDSFIVKQHNHGMGGVATMRRDTFVTNLTMDCVAYREGLLIEKIMPIPRQINQLHHQK